MCSRLQGEAVACAKLFTPGWSGMQACWNKESFRALGVVTCATDHDDKHECHRSPSTTGSVQGARPGKTPVEL